MGVHFLSISLLLPGLLVLAFLSKPVDLFLPRLLHIVISGICRGGKIGVCYGRNADDLPTPDKAVQLIQLHNIKYVRIYDSNIQVLKAFANTGIELMIGIPNSDLLAFSQFQTNADTWLKNSILPYYPATRITYITVGAEVTEAPNNVSALVVPAMQNVLTSLKKAGLHRKIKVSSTHSLGVLSRSFPPSAGAFNSKYAFFLRPMLEFLAENQSPFMVNIYPYYAYRDSSSNVSLDYALFESSSEVIDPNTGLLYTNMIPKETGATPDNAQTYNTNLIRHVINDTGTPAKPGEEIDVYLFSLFNENRKPGLESERNWGLFFPDQTSVYNLDFTGKGAVDMTTNATNITGSNGTTWCIASPTASDADLKNGLDWACSSGNVDCSAIQPSQPCFEPDNLASHASYAFNSYYQQNGATDIACSFGGAGFRTNKNPSYDSCLYLTSGTNKTATANATATPSKSSSSVEAVSMLVLGSLLTASFAFM
ncbi:Glucan endo-1,3-beta-glucosidase 13 [Sesamum angolense]|uniref:Glucan endo-1,3-beta-glucosidase 13 n=1 Tax=Sesamum angolense TaxID=2727404 RepID=A0AAE1WEC6_9LAMI|nr:Glucan endo-1,3-beta-glucosidase 13 [Sesamum angolense]